eukprot:11098632-Heterocapsa_arctica.AAC.1
MPGVKTQGATSEVPQRPVPKELRKEADQAEALAKALKAHNLPLHSDHESELSHPSRRDAHDAQKWLWYRAPPEDIEPMRGIDYVVSRAAIDADIAADSKYGMFLREFLHVCTDDMALHLPMVLCISILQTLQQSKGNAGKSTPSGWLTSMLPKTTQVEYFLAQEKVLGATAVIKMPEDMAWRPAISEPSVAKGKGKGKDKGKEEGSVPIWPKATKSAAQQGQMAILCCQDSTGEQFFWTGYVSEVHGDKAIQISTTEIPKSVSNAASSSNDGQGALVLNVQQILLSPFGASPNRIELFDLVSADHDAVLTQSSGLPSSREKQARMKEPAAIDARWKAGGEAMLIALKDILSCGIGADELEAATPETLQPFLLKSAALAAIHRAAGIKGVHAVATRILPPLAQFPSYLIATLSDIFCGARMQFLEGCPGAAKTDLVVCMALWMFTFTDLNII